MPQFFQNTPVSLSTSPVARKLAMAALILASATATPAFACAAPLAGLAAFAALRLPARAGALAVGAAWLANQAIGFLALHYPWSGDCLAWGLAIGAGAFAAFFVARLIAPRHALSQLASFLAAFAASQSVLVASAIVSGGGFEGFTPAIIGDVFLINAAAFALLLAAERLTRAKTGGVPQMARA